MVSFLRGACANWLLAHVLLSKIFTYAVKYLSFAIIFLLFSPFYNKYTRIAAAIFIFCFHWGLSPFLNVQHFCFSTMPFIFLLMPAPVWEILGLKTMIPPLVKEEKPKLK